MSEQGDTVPPAQLRRGMPASVRLKLKQAVKAHVAAHGSRKNRHLLREDPEFSPWIGQDVGNGGETGDKRLDRLFNEVKKEALRTKRPLPSSSTDLSGEGESQPDPLPQILAGGAPAVGHAELQARQRRQLELLEHAMRNCFDEDGGLLLSDLFLKYNREHRAIVRDSAELARIYRADTTSADLQRRVLAAAFESHAGDPEKARALAAAIDQVFSECTGLSARGAGR